MRRKPIIIRLVCLGSLLAGFLVWLLTGSDIRFERMSGHVYQAILNDAPLLFTLTQHEGLLHWEPHREFDGTVEPTTNGFLLTRVTGDLVYTNYASPFEPFPAQGRDTNEPGTASASPIPINPSYGKIPLLINRCTNVIARLELNESNVPVKLWWADGVSWYAPFDIAQKWTARADFGMAWESFGFHWSYHAAFPLLRADRPDLALWRAVNARLKDGCKATAGEVAERYRQLPIRNRLLGRLGSNDMDLVHWFTLLACSPESIILEQMEMQLDGMTTPSPDGRVLIYLQRRGTSYELDTQTLWDLLTADDSPFTAERASESLGGAFAPQMQRAQFADQDWYLSGTLVGRSGMTPVTYTLTPAEFDRLLDTHGNRLLKPLKPVPLPSWQGL